MNLQNQPRNTPTPLLMIFWFNVVLCVTTTIATLIPGIQDAVNPWFLYPLMLSLIIGTGYHAVFALGRSRGLLLLGLGAIIGFLAEAISLRTGTIFGSLYTYRTTPIMLFDVPIEVMLFWGVFIYFGYSLTNSFLTWSGFKKPNKANNSFVLLLCLVALDGFFVTAIDVVMDPIKVAAGDWTWLEQGSYFGIPFGNFLGWFFVTILVAGIFRLIEFQKPKPVDVKQTVFLMPTIFYLLTACGLIAASLASRMYDLTLIAFFILLLPSLTNLVLYAFWRDKQTRKTAIGLQ